MKWKWSIVALVLLLVLVSTGLGDTIKYHDGRKEHYGRITYHQEQLNVDDGKNIHRDLVKEIFFETTQQQAKDEAQAEEIPKDIEQILSLAQRQTEKYPDSDGIILLDDGTFVLNEDGTNVYRYHFQGLILKEEKKKEWGDNSLYFDEKRERIKLLWARTIKPTGEAANLDPTTVTITDEPGREVHFSKDKIFSYTLPEVDVGCIVEYSYEREEFDPFDKEMFFPSYYFQAYEPVWNSKMTVVVPSTKTLNYKAYNMLPGKEEPLITQNEKSTTYVWELTDVPPIIPEPSMPPYRAVVPGVTASLFKDWNYIFDWMNKMQQRRIEITPEIKRTVEEVTASATTVEEKIALLYQYVQQHIRYISIKGSIGSGWSGHEAFFTLENKYGDCIDKAILFSTMLKLIGVESEPVVIMTNDSGEEDRVVPTMYGNHAITAVHLNDKDFYLDTTSIVHRYPSFRADDHGVTTINALRREIGFVDVPPPEDNQRSYRLNVKVLPSGDAEVNYQSQYVGDYEARVRITYMYHYKESEYDRVLSNMISSISPKAVLKDYKLQNIHDISKPFSIKLSYTLKDYVVQASDLRILGVPGIETEFKEIGLPDRNYDIAYDTSYEKIQNVTITVPNNYRIKYMPQEIHLETPYATYTAKYTVENDSTIVFHDDFRRLKRKVPVEDYAKYKTFLQQVSKYSKEQMFFELQ